MTRSSDTSGSAKMAHCPSFGDWFIAQQANRPFEEQEYGYVIGYNYHGGHTNTPWPALPGFTATPFMYMLFGALPLDYTLAMLVYHVLQVSLFVAAVTVLGVEPHIIDYGLELSPALQQALPEVIDAARMLIDRLMGRSHGRRGLAATSP